MSLEVAEFVLTENNDRNNDKSEGNNNQNNDNNDRNNKGNNDNNDLNNDDNERNIDHAYNRPRDCHLSAS